MLEKCNRDFVPFYHTSSMHEKAPDLTKRYLNPANILRGKNLRSVRLELSFDIQSNLEVVWLSLLLLSNIFILTITYTTRSRSILDQFSKKNNGNSSLGVHLSIAYMRDDIFCLQVFNSVLSKHYSKICPEICWFLFFSKVKSRYCWLKPYNAIYCIHPIANFPLAYLLFGAGAF